MSKNKNHDNDRENNKKGFKIPKDPTKLAKMNFKKFKKENKGEFDSKKEAKHSFFEEMLDLLPDSISMIVRYGHLQDVKDVKAAIFTKISDPEFSKFLRKELKDDLEFNNMQLLPMLINEIVISAAKEEADLKAADPNCTIHYDVNDLIEISHMILKKKLKKAKKVGINEDLAFDLLSVMPSTKILVKSQNFHIKNVFSVLYNHAKTEEIDFEKIIKFLFKDGEEYISSVITFALLERKEKITAFNDSQKKLFNDITNFVFQTMESMRKEDIKNILNAYCNTRKHDEANKRDTNRRYYISSLPENDYPKIIKVVNDMIKEDENLKKYF